MVQRSVNGSGVALQRRGRETVVIYREDGLRGSESLSGGIGVVAKADVTEMDSSNQRYRVEIVRGAGDGPLEDGTLIEWRGDLYLIEGGSMHVRCSLPPTTHVMVLAGDRP